MTHYTAYEECVPHSVLNNFQQSLVVSFGVEGTWVLSLLVLSPDHLLQSANCHQVTDGVVTVACWLVRMSGIGELCVRMRILALMVGTK